MHVSLANRDKARLVKGPRHGEFGDVTVDMEPLSSHLLTAKEPFMARYVRKI